jgi:hypothetical protein
VAQKETQETLPVQESLACTFPPGQKPPVQTGIQACAGFGVEIMARTVIAVASRNREYVTSFLRIMDDLLVS